MVGTQRISGLESVFNLLIQEEMDYLRLGLDFQC